MPQFTTKRRVRHSAADMFDLVADVERYPEFVPFCSSLKVRRRGHDEGGRDTITCEMTVVYKLIHETFTTRVTLDKAELQILVDYLSGPFNRLDNRWRFRDVEGERACDVEFYLHYEFRSRTLGMLMGAMFEVVFRRFADAFEKRADQIYAGRGA
ncbi:MAG TPA: type II toxin-antitoxin system RatA family toxin [Xanthobacteraceae bacterium]|jgi:coenzyme Q-binding protein COQ10|nr:type II toxin-antitoxin system RatA family toxin [Xanthobacteraceae bacterium]